MRHILKTRHEPFQAVWEGVKTFEVRKNDREYQAEDSLLLKEYDPDTNTYSGREILIRVPYVLYGGAFGLPDDMCVMSLNMTSRIRNETINGACVPFQTVAMQRESEDG